MKTLGRHSVAALAATFTVVIGTSSGSAWATDLRGAGAEDLRWELRTLSPRIDREPRATAYDLEQLQRRLFELRVDRPNDPALGQLELQLRQERWRADRIIEQRNTARETLHPDRQGSPLPAYLSTRLDADLRGEQVPIGTGRRLIRIQSGLRDAAAQLDRGRIDAARERTAKAEADLLELRSGLADVATGDPNLVALEAELAAIKERIDGTGRAR
jgi:hypothetical protein